MTLFEWVALKFAKHEVKKYLGGNMDIKDGWKTTEFWSVHLTQVVWMITTVLALWKINLTPQQQQQLVLLAGAIITTIQVFYTKGRSDLKIAQVQSSNSVTEAPVSTTTVNTGVK